MSISLDTPAPAVAKTGSKVTSTTKKNPATTGTSSPETCLVVKRFLNRERAQRKYPSEIKALEAFDKAIADSKVKAVWVFDTDRKEIKQWSRAQ